MRRGSNPLGATIKALRSKLVSGLFALVVKIPLISRTMARYKTAFSMTDQYAQYKSIILEQLQQASETKMHHTGSGLTRVKLKDELSRTLSASLSELVASKVDIVVDENLFNDAIFINEVVERFAKTILIQYQFAEQFFPNTTQESFINLISYFSLTLTSQ